MNKLICQKCGSEISKKLGVTLTYCTNCEANIQHLQPEQTASVEGVPTLVSPKPTNQISQARPKRTGIFLGCLGLGFAAILLSALFLVYFQTCKISWLSPLRILVPCSSTNAGLLAESTDLFTGSALPEIINQLKKEIGGKVKAISIHIRVCLNFKI